MLTQRLLRLHILDLLLDMSGNAFDDQNIVLQWLDQS